MEVQSRYRHRLSRAVAAVLGGTCGLATYYAVMGIADLLDAPGVSLLHPGRALVRAVLSALLYLVGGSYFLWVAWVGHRWIGEIDPD